LLERHGAEHIAIIVGQDERDLIRSGVAGQAGYDLGIFGGSVGEGKAAGAGGAAREGVVLQALGIDA
jgi:hypothetical protein